MAAAKKKASKKHGMGKKGGEMPFEPKPKHGMGKAKKKAPKK